MAVVAEDFLGLYLKEIGVQTPVSSFLSVAIKNSSSDIKKSPIVSEQSVIYIASESSITKPEQRALGVAEAAPIIAAPEIELPGPVVAEVQSVKTTTITTVSDLKSLKKQALVCAACELSACRNEVVFGSGSGASGIVFIADSPSRAEDLAGEAMIGEKGELFTQMLAAVGFSRDDVYVMHGVKCRPTHGRSATPEEFVACEQWLLAQLDLLKPRMICLLGRVVAQNLLNIDLSLTDLRKKQHSFRGIPALVLDDPTFLLRVPGHKARAWEDLNRLKNFYQSLPANQ